MFGKKKKKAVNNEALGKMTWGDVFGKKEKKTINNEVFGEMIHWGVAWESTSKIDITLWNKTYPTEISVAARRVEDGINEKQEEAYRYFRKTITERQKEVERLIAEDYQIKEERVLSEKFTPTELVIGEKGECGLYLDDNEEEYDPDADQDRGVAVSLFPELKVCSKEEYAGYIYGGGGLWE